MLTSKYKPATVNVSIAAINSYLKFVGRTELMLKSVKVQKNSFENSDKELSKMDYEKLIKTAIQSKMRGLRFLFRQCVQQGFVSQSFST